MSGSIQRSPRFVGGEDKSIEATLASFEARVVVTRGVGDRSISKEAGLNTTGVEIGPLLHWKQGTR